MVYCRRGVKSSLKMKWMLSSLILFFASPAWATLGAGATYYIDFSLGDGGDGSYGSPYDDWPTAFANGGGNVYIVKIGTWTQLEAVLSSVPAGTATMPTMIKAEENWRAIITRADSLALDSGNAHRTDFIGIKWNYAGQKTVSGTYLRFFHCRFKGGEPTGNNVQVSLGFGGVTSHHILLEDCVVWGSGGRYNIMKYNVQYCTLRRVVVRHDGGWDDEGSENPEAGITSYDAADLANVNTIVLDSTGPYVTWVGAYYYVDNNTAQSDHALANTFDYGTICLRADEACYRGDANATLSSGTWVNTVSWDPRRWGFSFGSGSNFTGRIDGFTIIQTSVSAGSTVDGISDFGTFSGVIRNGNISGFDDTDLNGVSATYFNSHGNGTTSNGTGRISSAPFTNGQLYTTRIETGTVLSTAGLSGVPMGAMIEKKLGTSGTHIYETGWVNTTTDNLWPWPNESNVKAELCENSTIGLCDPSRANVTFTQYVVGNHANHTSPYSAEQGGGQALQTQWPLELRGNMKFQGNMSIKFQ